MNNEIKNSLLKAAYNLLEENPEQFILNTVQVIISAVVEMTDMEMPDENNDAEPFYDEESNIMYHDGKDARIAYLKSIIDAKNIKIAELEKRIVNLRELVDVEREYSSKIKLYRNEKPDLQSVLENNKIKLIKAIRKVFTNEKYNYAVVRGNKSVSDNHISNLKQ